MRVRAPTMRVARSLAYGRSIDQREEHGVKHHRSCAVMWTALRAIVTRVSKLSRSHVDRSASDSSVSFQSQSMRVRVPVPQIKLQVTLHVCVRVSSLVQ